MSDQHSIDFRMDRKRYTSWSANRPTRPTFLKEEPQSSKKGNCTDSLMIEAMIKINRALSDKLADPATMDSLVRWANSVPIQPQGEVKDITLMDSNCQLDTQVETVVYRLPKDDVSDTQDGLVPTGSDYNIVGLDDDYEDVVVHDGEISGRDEQTLSIHDFAEREYQAQLDASSHEVEAGGTSHDLSSQLKVSKDSIVTSLSHHDRMRDMIEDHIQMIQLQGRHKGFQEESSCVDLQGIREGMGTMKLSYLHPSFFGEYSIGITGLGET